MIVLVCGGRWFKRVGFLWRSLDEVHKKTPITRIIEGASDDVTGPYLGADYWAHQWAKARCVLNTRYHANWKEDGRAAGPIRNTWMLRDGRPDMVIAFDGGNGTADMVRKAKAAKVNLIEVSSAPSP